MSRTSRTSLLNGSPRVVRTAPSLAYAGDGGGGRAEPVANAVLGTAIFVAAEAMLFAGLIAAFLVLRAGAGPWPPAGQPRLPIGVTGANTVLLLLSAVTMRRATTRARSRPRELRRWLATTAALGATFLAIQGSEWLRLLRHGLTASSSVYGGIFYTIIGCHGLHVLGAMGALLLLQRRVMQAPRPERLWGALSACALYWFFVVGLWPILYVLVYLA